MRSLGYVKNNSFAEKRYDSWVPLDRDGLTVQIKSLANTSMNKRNWEMTELAEKLKPVFGDVKRSTYSLCFYFEFPDKD
jgi:hypothetical protein